MTMTHQCTHCRTATTVPPLRGLWDALRHNIAWTPGYCFFCGQAMSHVDVCRVVGCDECAMWTEYLVIMEYSN